MNSGDRLLGDYLRVLDALCPADAAARVAVASAFGFELARDPGIEVEPLRGLRWLDEQIRPSLPGDGRMDDRDETDVSGPPSIVLLPELTPGDPGTRPRDSSLDRAGRDEAARPQWLVQAEPLDPPVTGERPEQAPDPLLLPRWTAGILSIALATTAPDGPVDVDRLVEQVASLQPVVELPRSPRPTLRAGAQILVDLSESMMPYLADEVDLLSSIDRVMGGGPIEVLRFAGCPTRGAGPGGRHTWTPYERPVTPRPVVLISDLGLGARANSRDASTAHDWHTFASEVRRARCPLVAFVPFRRERLPRLLRRVVSHVMWDRETTAGTAARAVRTKTPV